MPFTKEREQFPFLNEVKYFDSASVSPPPEVSLRAMYDYYHHNPYNYGVGNFDDAWKVQRRVDEVRSRLLDYLHGKPGDAIVLTKNTTEAINILSNGIKFKPGDEIILTELEHQSNLIPWFRLQSAGLVKIRIVEADANGLIDESKIKKMINERTKLIGVTHVSNLYGSIQPVEAIGEIANDAGVTFFVDAAQSLGRISVDVSKIKCDFMAICGRKGLLGPQGTGALYAKKGLLDSIEPTIVGSRGANIDKFYNVKLLDPPQKFESGVLNTAGFIGLGKSIEFLQSIGQSRIEGAIRELTAKLLDGLRSVPGLTVYRVPPLEKSAGILSWNIKGVSSFKVSERLFRDHRIVVGSGAHGSVLGLKSLGIDDVVRTSIHFFNTEEEIDYLIDSLKSFKF